MRSTGGAIAVGLVAVLLGVLAVSQFRSQDVYSRSIQLETPASLTTLIAGLADKNSALRDEIFDLRLRVAAAGESVSTGQFSLTEGERQLSQLRVFAAQDAITGPGVSVTIDGAFDDKAMSDLVNELRNAGAEGIAINDRRVGPRSWFAPGSDRDIALDGARLGAPWVVRAVGPSDVIFVAMTRTGGIVGQFELIYRSTRFRVVKEPTLDLPPLR
jgi:uncharacterized protein YlxW (UPF0749 family)